MRVYIHNAKVYTIVLMRSEKKAHTETTTIIMGSEITEKYV